MCDIDLATLTDRIDIHRNLVDIVTARNRVIDQWAIQIEYTACLYEDLLYNEVSLHYKIVHFSSNHYGNH